MAPRFLLREELDALKFAIGMSHGLDIEQCEGGEGISRHFLAPGTNFMYYDTGEERICFAWILASEGSFCEYLAHEEIHRVLHEVIDLKSCCDYDNIARFAEAVDAEPSVRAVSALMNMSARALERSLRPVRPRAGKSLLFPMERVITMVKSYS